MYWNQDPQQRIIKPDIHLQHYDPLYAATRQHFKVLIPPVLCLVCVCALHLLHKGRFSHMSVTQSKLPEPWSCTVSGIQDHRLLHVSLTHRVKQLSIV